jgi:Protein of unknown function (DUF3108)
MKPYIRLILLLFLCGKSLIAIEKIDLTIRYLGLPVVNVVMTDSGDEIKVTAKATSIASIAAKMDNQYISSYTDVYLTSLYHKIVNQKNYEENRIIIYDREGLVAQRTSYILPEKNKEYPINSESRDFFSALFYLRKLVEIQPQGEIWLDANTMIWKATYKIIETEKIKTELGRMKAIKVKFTFKQISEGEKENSDMLTNNLVTEKRALYLWFSDDERKIPLQAKFMMKPFSVTWRLEKYINN